MSIRGAVMGTRYYTLDSVAIADGEAANAHTLRAMSMSANRLLCTGEPVLTLVWDATTGATESTLQGCLRGYGTSGLVRVAGPMLVPKKPGLRTMEVNVTALVGGTNTCDFLMTTRASRYRPDFIGLAGAIVMSGNGTTDYQHYAATGVPCMAGDDFEELTFYMRGRPTTTLAASGTSSGTIDSPTDYVNIAGLVVDDGVSFHTSLPFAHEIEFQNSSNVAIMPRKLIIERPSGGLLYVAPTFTWLETRRVVGAQYKIYQLPTWRIACVNVNTEDREA